MIVVFDADIFEEKVSGYDELIEEIKQKLEALEKNS